MAVTGASEKAVVGSDIVKLLTSEMGAPKGVGPKACIIPIINRVDSPARHRQALEIVEHAPAATSGLTGVVLGRTGEATPRMEFVERSWIGACIRHKPVGLPVFSCRRTGKPVG